MQVETTADTAADGTVSGRRGGGDGRVSEGVHKVFTVRVPHLDDLRRPPLSVHGPRLVGQPEESWPIKPCRPFPA